MKKIKFNEFSMFELPPQYKYGPLYVYIDDSYTHHVYPYYLEKDDMDRKSFVLCILVPGTGLINGLNPMISSKWDCWRLVVGYIQSCNKQEAYVLTNE